MVVPVAVGMREAGVEMGMAPQVMEVAVEPVKLGEALLGPRPVLKVRLGTVMAVDPLAMAPALEMEVKVEEIVDPLEMIPLEQEETEMTLAPYLQAMTMVVEMEKVIALWETGMAHLMMAPLAMMPMLAEAMMAFLGKVVLMVTAMEVIIVPQELETDPQEATLATTVTVEEEMDPMEMAMAMEAEEMALLSITMDRRGLEAHPALGLEGVVLQLLLELTMALVLQMARLVVVVMGALVALEPVLEMEMNLEMTVDLEMGVGHPALAATPLVVVTLGIATAVEEMAVEVTAVLMAPQDLQAVEIAAAPGMEMGPVIVVMEAPLGHLLVLEMRLKVRALEVILTMMQPPPGHPPALEMAVALQMTMATVIAMMEAILGLAMAVEAALEMGMDPLVTGEMVAPLSRAMALALEIAHLVRTLTLDHLVMEEVKVEMTAVAAAPRRAIPNRQQLWSSQPHPPPVSLTTSLLLFLPYRNMGTILSSSKRVIMRSKSLSPDPGRLPCGENPISSTTTRKTKSP